MTRAALLAVIAIGAGVGAEPLTGAAPRNCPSVLAAVPRFSPRGGWIAFELLRQKRGASGRCESGLATLEVVRPNGRGRHVVVRGTLDWWDWSPSGRRIAAAVVGQRMSRVLVARPDRSGAAAVAAAAGVTALWSPTGDRIAVARAHADRPPDVVVAAADGSASEVVGSLASVRGKPFDWSPDGRRVVFVAPVGQAAAIVVARLDGSGTTRVGEGIVPDWAPRGEAIAFAGRSPLGTAAYVGHATGSDLRRLGRRCNAGRYAWSPTARHIALVGHCGFSDFETDPPIEVVDLRSGTSVDVGVGFPVWAPSGAWLALGERWGVGGFRRVSIISPTGRRIADFPGAGPAWAPDGKRLLFFTFGTIWIADADGTHARAVAAGVAADWAPDSHAVVVARETSCGPRLVLVDARTRRSTALTRC